MHCLVVVHDAQGNILDVTMQQVQNISTWAADRYLVYGDGRSRPVDPARTVLLTPAQPEASNVIGWWRDGRYYIDPVTRELYEVADWTPPEVTPDAPQS